MSTIASIRTSLAPELESINALMARSLHSPNPLVNEVTRNYLRNKGKQLRPIMVILTARMLGAPDIDKAVTSAASIEMLHNASLIHDDVIDESATRHGVATINSVWDNHIAVLIGDYFVSTALPLVISTGDLRAISTIASLGRLLATGELDQIDTATTHTISEEAYFKIITNKTASLFMACVEMGAYAAQASEADLDTMREFARIFGQCFQIKDDIFDYFSSEALGKPTGNDLREGKITLPLLYALSLASHPRHAEMNALAARDSLTDSEIATLIDFAVAAGGIRYAEDCMRTLRDKAAALLGQISTGGDTAPLLALLDYIIDREY
ncbi:MAG: polyprenyl synthetase family protein [Duncaniella sp.]|nr:polyprenyl synthetase family protein [Duncaniella sp.]